LLLTAFAYLPHVNTTLYTQLLYKPAVRCIYTLDEVDPLMYDVADTNNTVGQFTTAM